MLYVYGAQASEGETQPSEPKAVAGAKIQKLFIALRHQGGAIYYQHSRCDHSVHQQNSLHLVEGALCTVRYFILRRPRRKRHRE